MLSGYTVQPDSNETKHVSSDQEASPSAGTSTGVYGNVKYMEVSLSSDIEIPEVTGCHSLQHITSQWGSQNYFKDWYLLNSKPNFLIFTSFLTIIKSTKTR